MYSGSDSHLHGFWPVNRAPGLGSRQPEHLFRCKIESGQAWFGTMLLSPLFVCVICFLDATVVRNVLALGVDTVEVELHIWLSVVAVLFDDAAGLLQVRLLGIGLPPVYKVSVLVELSSLVVETVRNLVTNNETNCSIVHVLWSFV